LLFFVRINFLFAPRYLKFVFMERFDKNNRITVDQIAKNELAYLLSKIHGRFVSQFLPDSVRSCYLKSHIRIEKHTSRRDFIRALLEPLPTCEVIEVLNSKRDRIRSIIDSKNSSQDNSCENVANLGFC